MTPEEALNNINNAVEQTAKDMMPVMEEAALTGKGLLARRVINTGFGKKYTSRGYISLRAKRGFEIRFVNLTFTGNMFRGWSKPNAEKDGLVVRGTVGGVDKPTQDKLGWNKSRYPNFDQSSDEEKEIIKDKVVQPRLLEAIKRNLFKQ